MYRCPLWCFLMRTDALCAALNRKANSKESMEWLRVLARASIPVLVCLTHADKLVAELMPEPGVVPDPAESQKCI